MHDTVWTSLEPEKKPLFVPSGIAYVFVRWLTFTARLLEKFQGHLFSVPYAQEKRSMGTRRQGA
jgi:hypothetical protein